MLAVTVPRNGPGCGTLTYKELYRKAAQFSNALKKQELMPGDKIAVLMSNRIEVPIIMLGARWAGVDMVLLSTHVLVSNLARLIEEEEFQPKLLIAGNDYIGLANQLAEMISPDIARVLASDGFSPYLGWKSFDDMVAAEWDYMPTKPLNGQLLLTSGGSTGLQKIVKPQIAADGASLFTSLAANPAAGKVLGFKEENVVLATGPLYHAMGSSVMTNALNAGAHLVIMPQKEKEAWDARAFMEFIDTYSVTHTMMVPTMMERVNRLLNLVGLENFNTSSLQIVVHGAAPCPKSVKRAFMDYFTGKVYEVYGGTEGFIVTIASPEDWNKYPGTVGRPLAPIVIRDEEGRQVPNGTPGVIWGVIPPGVTPMSYMGREEETNACIVSRGDSVLEGTLWDIGYVNDEGLLFITGRQKDMLIIGGANVYPNEIEEVLHNHPNVADVAVVGIDHPALGEVPVAVVEATRIDHGTLETELHALCKEAGLSSHATPRTILIVEKLPRTPTGKMPKSEVRDLVLAAL